MNCFKYHVAQVLLLLVLPSLAIGARPLLFVSLIESKKILTFDRNDSTGELTLLNETTCVAEPGVLYPSPDRRTLFVAMRSTGQLASFRIEANGALTLLSLVEGGEDPCYFYVDRTGKYLFTAYYVANKVTVHVVDSTGRIHPEPLQTVPTAKNAHAIHLDSSDQFAFVPHTGGNKIFQFRFDPRNGPLVPMNPAWTELSPGDEPRHVAVHPSGKWVFSNNEAGDSLNAFSLDPTNGLKRIQRVTTLREGFDPAKNTTARCEMTSDGKFIYVANRGSNAIAAFQINAANGRLSKLGIVDTEKTPRSFSIDPKNQFLYAAGQDNGFVRLYRIEERGSLETVRRYQVGPKPWCVLAIDALVSKLPYVSVE